MDEKPFTQPVPVRDIPAKGKKLRLTADEYVRAGLADRLGIPAVEQLEADLEISPAKGDSLRVRGTIEAEVVQTCSVTLEPVRQSVQETVDVIFLPQETAGDLSKTIAVDPMDEEDHEYIRDGRLDLGQVVIEHLALGLDPYPRKSGADFAALIEDDKADRLSPFDSLKQLKKNTS